MSRYFSKFLWKIEGAQLKIWLVLRGWLNDLILLEWIYVFKLEQQRIYVYARILSESLVALTNIS